MITKLVDMNHELYSTCMNIPYRVYMLYMLFYFFAIIAL